MAMYPGSIPSERRRTVNIWVIHLGGKYDMFIYEDIYENVVGVESFPWQLEIYERSSS